MSHETSRNRRYRTMKSYHITKDSVKLIAVLIRKDTFPWPTLTSNPIIIPPGHLHSSLFLRNDLTFLRNALSFLRNRHFTSFFSAFLIRSTSVPQEQTFSKLFFIVLHSFQEHSSGIHLFNYHSSLVPRTFLKKGDLRRPFLAFFTRSSNVPQEWRF